MQTIHDDLCHAIRQLRKSPGFAITAVLTLALGIGATTAIFTLVYDVLLKPLPYSHPEQLVVTEEQVAEFRDIYPTLPMNANHFAFWQQHSRSFQSLAIMKQGSMPLGLSGHPLQISVLSATPRIFSVLDSMPRLGRPFSSQEDQPGHEHVVVLMDNLWRNQFQSDPGILGKRVTLNGFSYIVIGVMPRSFRAPFMQTFGGKDGERVQLAEALVPMALSKDDWQQTMGDFDYFGLARLKPGVSASQATAEIDALQRTIMSRLSANEKATLSATLTPFQKALVGSNQRPLLILLAAVAGLLLVGCVNITKGVYGVVTYSVVQREREIGLRLALGAQRQNIYRLVLHDGLMPVLSGAVAGVVVAFASARMVRSLLFEVSPYNSAITASAVGVLVAVGLAACLLPARRSRSTC